MADKLTFDALWNELKDESEEAKELLEVSESIANIINSIVSARINKGWTQRDLAAACGVKQSAIARMERLQVVPRLDTIVKIANKLDIRLATEIIPVEVTVSEPVSVTVSVSETTTHTEDNLIRYRFNPKSYIGLAAAVFGG